MVRSSLFIPAALCLLISCTQTPMEELHDSQESSPPAQRKDFQSTLPPVSLTWNTPGPEPSCPVCGSPDYACAFQEDWIQGKTFTDPATPGSKVISLDLAIAYRNGLTRSLPDGGTSCSPGGPDSVQVKLNGVLLDSFSVQGTCSCSTCSSGRVRIENPAGIPGYVYRGTNTLQLETTASDFCVTSARLNLVSELRRLEVTPSSLSFGDQPAGSTSPSQPVEITNTGDSMVTLSELRTTTGFTLLDGPTVPLDLAVGQRETLQVAFAPSSSGNVTGELRIRSNDSLQATRIVSLSGRGFKAVSLSPASLDFGRLRVGSTSSALEVTLTNNSSSTVTITQITPPASSFLISNLTPQQTIDPGHNLTFQVRFSPTVPGPISSSLGLQTDAPNGALTLPLSGHGLSASISLSPSPLTFPNQRVGSTSDNQTLLIQNTGTGPLQLTEISTEPPFAATVTSLPRTLEAGEVARIPVKITPARPGPVSGLLTVMSDLPNTPHTVELRGNGIAPQLRLEPTSLAFGDVELGSTRTLSLHLTNTGTDTLHFLELNAERPFSSAQPPPPLIAGATATLQVTFTPTSLGVVDDGVLTLKSDAYGTPEVRVPLSGKGVGPRLVLQSREYFFGSLNMGETSAPVELIVSNRGDAALKISALTLSGAHAGDFEVRRPTITLELAPNASASIPAYFKPTAVGERSARVTLVSNDALNPSVDVALGGTGTSPHVTVAPASLAFGEVPVGSISRPSPVSLTNTGTGPLKLSLLASSGAASASFVLEERNPPLTLPLTLQPRGSLVLWLTFRPRSLRAHEATLAISSDDPEQAGIALPLSGSGSSPIVSLSRMVVDFGGHLVGQEARARTVALTNTGNARLTVSRLEVGGAQAGQFRLVSPPPLPLQLEPGATQPLEVVFSPSAAGEAAASILLASDTPGAPEAKVSLRGVGLDAVLAVSPTRVDFGTQVAPARPPESTVTLTNVGSDPLVLGPAALSGSHRERFTVSFQPRTLAPGESTTATVAWRADVAMEASAQLDFGTAQPSTARAVSVALEGKAVARFLTVEPMNLDFGGLLVGQKSPPALITLINQATAPLSVKEVLSGHEAFQIDPVGLDGPIAPGQTGTFLVTFKPKAEGLVSSEVRVLPRGEGATEITLSATGSGQMVVMEGGGHVCSSGGSGTGSGLLGALLLLAMYRRTRRAGSVAGKVANHAGSISVA